MVRRRLIGRRSLHLILAAILVGGCATSPLPSHGPVGSAPGTPPADAESTPRATLDLASSAWRRATILEPDPRTFLASASRGLVAGDRTAWAGTAEDAWIPADPVEPDARQGLVAWRGGFVDWGEQGAVRTSADGLLWRDAETGPGEANLSMIVPAGGRLLLVGSGIDVRTGAWLSDDGRAWTADRNAPAELTAAADWPGRGMIASGRSGADATIWISAGGVGWAAAAAPTPLAGHAVVSGLATSGTTVVAVGDIDGRPAAWHSADLLTWMESPAVWGPDAFAAGVTSVAGIFAMPGRRANRPVVWLSPDGSVWSAVDLPLAPGVDGAASKVIAVDGAIVVFGDTTRDEGNGGSSRVAPLIWILDLKR